MANIETLAAATRYYEEAAAPSTPSSGQGVTYFKTDGKYYAKNDAGTEYDLTSTSGTFVGVHAYHNAAQTITTATDTVVALNSERYDTDAFHDTSTNNSRLTVPSGKAGKYLAIFNCEFQDVAGTGIREARIKVNGTTWVGLMTVTATSNKAHRLNVSAIIDLSVGDYVEAFVRQESGGNCDLTSNANWSPELMLSKIG